MDPMTLASKQFLTELESFWNPPATVPLPAGPRVLRLVVSPSERGDLLKALRWLEWSADNRHPIVLFEDAFENATRWLRGLVAKTANDCEAVRKGLTEDRIPMAPLPAKPAEATIDAATARHYLDSVAEHMAGGVLDGLLVVLAPRRVTNLRAYRGTLAKIVALPIGAALRLVVVDVPEADLAALLPSAARFEVDRAELFAFLRLMGTKPSKGPPMPKRASASPATPEPHHPSERTAEPLRVLLLDAGQALAEGKPKLAIQHLCTAEALARKHGLRAQECAIGIGLGGAQLAATDERAALTTYQHVMQRALAARLSPLAAQAMLGIAAVHFGRGRYAAARAAYEILACMTTDMPVLAQEAERMQKQCRELELA
jgi:hypothetical protein